MKQIFALLALMASTHALADWLVDPDGSYLGFASVKNDLIAENHSFTNISGTVRRSGEAEIVVSLASVETLIPIRNERMQAMLFEVETYPNATITSTIDVDDFTGLEAGQSITRDIRLSIDLHGAQISRNAKVKVTRSADTVFEVSSLGPILVHASQFALADGVEALRNIAGLQSIELMVPITFDLRLVAETN
ncbi:MAG: YceI family protein [Pseudomonadales bacterium]|nr:YceI family protein [Pseudomonadales bacterium]MBO6565144.1 YceI family protein [Pseudomonadales bacterium]MBO6595283.1 YceI family protein [Pseudomonadales bacterium]MBO6821158.1 YceI family protein [Pseudomonadales bacterium]